MVAQSNTTLTTRAPIPWWISAIVASGVALTTLGGLLALFAPTLLVGAHSPMNPAAYVYAGYLVSRNLALALMLVVTLLGRARYMLAGLMLLTALTQVIDAAVDATTGRSSLLPVILLVAVTFLLGARKLL